MGYKYHITFETSKKKLRKCYTLCFILIVKKVLGIFAWCEKCCTQENLKGLKKWRTPPLINHLYVHIDSKASSLSFANFWYFYYWLHNRALLSVAITVLLIFHSLLSSTLSSIHTCLQILFYLREEGQGVLFLLFAFRTHF